jgi:hypothetical protein
MLHPAAIALMVLLNAISVNIDAEKVILYAILMNMAVLSEVAGRRQASLGYTAEE